MSYELKRFLYGKLGSFGDKRIKDINKGSLFIIDDRQPRDIDSRKDLYSYFCCIFAKVLSNEEIEVSLSRNIPQGPDVQAWIAAHNCTYSDSNGQLNLIFTVTKDTRQDLNSLATAIDCLLPPNGRHKIANYKYVIPRTAGSLVRFSDLLAEFWS